MRCPISTTVSTPRPASARPPSRRRGLPSSNAAVAGTSTGKNSRISAGPARGLLNGPVSAPSPQRAWPNRLAPSRYCCQISITIQPADAARTIHSQRCRLRPAGPVSSHSPSAAASRGRRTASTPSSSPPLPRAEQSTSHSHQAAAARAKGRRRNAWSRATQTWARKARSTQAISISAAARACSSASGSARQAASAAWPATRSSRMRCG